ncbi:phage tail protein [Pseudoduganella violacea]|uniref:Microcystin-dependent protein n=1 Tax=Pseudoduganella violacea TaxID=1715466 RepID=A0A7W5FTN9_9BURK|nr:tail fiber protein [Pseudoduganella violacea]MBB3118867.1 microcystin-dependent protein [Pseudoduganella violacea]
MDPILGQIILWPVPWVPQGWALCDGSILKVSDYQALFSLLGNKYGGDGRTTFALPDLRSKIALGTTTMNAVGQTSGAATATTTATASGSLSIGVNNLPAHSHTATFTPGAGASVSVAIPADGASSSDNVPAAGLVLGKAMAGAAAAKIYSNAASTTTLKPFNITVPAGSGTVSNDNTGGGQPLAFSVNVPVSLSTLQPGVTLNFIIATEGIYPSRP